MRIHIFLFLCATLSSIVDSAAWSLSNIMLSGSKANDIYTESVLNAVERGMEECRHQFQWEPWGCPKSSFNLFSRSNKQPTTKERAFLHAMISSSIVITVTRNCSSGHFSSCGCDASKRAGLGYKSWHWGGCSDNVKVGNKMAKQYLDSKETGRDLKALINLHNNRVGRTVVKKNMRRNCKCHGVSGSCEMQTCWMRVLDIRQVGDRLKEAYDAAQPFSTNINHYDLPSQNNKRTSDNNVRSNNAREKLKIPKQQLAYLDVSPNYCVADPSLGIPGTLGRQCSRSTGKKISRAERKSCKSLCRTCGHRVQMKTVVLEKTCKCKFYWCCRVKCKTCTEQILQHVCAAPERA